MHFFNLERDFSMNTNPFDLSFEIWLVKYLQDLNQSLPDFLTHWKSCHDLMNHEDMQQSLRTCVRISNGVDFFSFMSFFKLFFK